MSLSPSSHSHKHDVYRIAPHAEQMAMLKRRLGIPAFASVF